MASKATSKMTTQLELAESTEPVVQAVAKNVRAILKEVRVEVQVPGLRVHFPHFEAIGAGAKRPIYYTEGCLSVLPSTVVVNAEFLLATEAAIRSFGLFDALLETPYLRNDACMFGLVKRIREDRTGWVNALRRVEGEKKSNQRTVIDEVTLTVLFFVAHEVGHLKDAVNFGKYATFLDPSKPLETRLANAAIKQRRHASEFEALGFALGGFRDAILPETDVFAAAEKLRGPIADEDAYSASWFQKETSADEAAVEFMVRYLRNQPSMKRWLLIRGLFAAGLYGWYTDFLTFCERTNVPRMGPKPMLSFELMQDPEAYIQAASLFGDVHRATMLRSTLAIQAVLDAYTSADAKSGSLWDRVAKVSSLLLSRERPVNDRREWHWRRESAYRLGLLAIHMDIMVKLAYVGASLPWMSAVRDRQKIFIMQFDSIGQSVARLKKVMGV
jgi:hypothetical protein